MPQYSTGGPQSLCLLFTVVFAVHAFLLVNKELCLGKRGLFFASLRPASWR